MEKRPLSESLKLENPWRKSPTRFSMESPDPTARQFTTGSSRKRESLGTPSPFETFRSQLRSEEQLERNYEEPFATGRQETDDREVRRMGVSEEAYTLMSRLSGMESQKRISENEIANLRFELERTVRLRTAFEGQNNFLKSEILRLKSELETESSSRVQLLTLQENSQREVELLRAENEELQQQLTLGRQELLSSDRQMQELNTQLMAALQQVKRLEKDYESLTAKHSAAISQSSKAEQMNSALIEETKQWKALEARVHEFEREKTHLQGETASKKAEAQQKEIQVRKLEGLLAERENDLAELRSDMELLQRQNASLLQEKDLHQHRATSLSKKLALLESDFKNAEEDLCRLQQEKGALEDKLSDHQRKVGQFDRVETEMKKYRSLYAEAVATEKEARERLEAFERQLEDDRSQLEKTHGLLQRKQRVLEEGQSQFAKAAEENRRLESLVSELETSKNDLAIRLDQVTDAQRMTEVTVKRLESDLKAARETIARKEKELKQSLEYTQKDANEHVYIKKLLEEQRERNDELSEALRTRDQECAEALERVAGLQRQVEEATAEKTVEAETMQETAMRLQDELFRLEQERDQLKKAYESATRSERVTQQLVKTLEKEKEELRSSPKVIQTDRIVHSRSDSGRAQDTEQRVKDQEDLIAHYRKQIQLLECQLRVRPPSDLAQIYSELEAEKERTEQLEEMLAEQKQVNAELRGDLSGAQNVKALKIEIGSEEGDEWRDHADDQREAILSLEMEVMRLKDELGASKHLHFKADSKVRELERRLNALQSQSDFGESLET